MENSELEYSKFSNETLEQMVRELRPSWSLREVGRHPHEGQQVTYLVVAETPEGPRKCVLKTTERSAEAFRPEPYLIDAVDRRTSIPVPTVLGAVDDHDDLPAPYFLMDRDEGDKWENETEKLPIDTVAEFAYDAGRHFQQMHELGEFDTFGPIRLDVDVTDDRDDRGSGIAVDGRSLTVADDGDSSWRGRFRTMTDYALEHIDSRFADLEDELRAYIDDRIDLLDGTFPAVPGHDDYRLGNLLVDTETAETLVVLDWGNPQVMDPQYNLVLTEQSLGDWPRQDDPLREHVRDAIREGYRDEGDESSLSFLDDPEAERRRELYLLGTRLYPLAGFSMWYADKTEAEREAWAEKHRTATRQLLDS